MLAVLEDGRGRPCSDRVPVPDTMPTLLDLVVTRGGAVRVTFYDAADEALMWLRVDDVLSPGDTYHLNLTDLDVTEE